jgi:hypothetical protein
MHFVQPNAVHRNGLSVSEDHGFADKLGLGVFELTEDRGPSQLAWVTLVKSLSGSVFAFERCVSRDRRAAKGCRRNRDVLTSTHAGVAPKIV